MIVANLLLHLTGGDNASGPWYLEESGFVALLGFAAAGWTWFKNSRCHVDDRVHGGKNCWRRGHYPFRHYKVCKKHHPEVPEHITHLHIKKLHKDSYEH